MRNQSNPNSRKNSLSSFDNNSGGSKHSDAFAMTPTIQQINAGGEEVADALATLSLDSQRARKVNDSMLINEGDPQM